MLIFTITINIVLPFQFHFFSFIIVPFHNHRSTIPPQMWSSLFSNVHQQVRVTRFTSMNVRCLLGSGIDGLGQWASIHFKKLFPRLECSGYICFWERKSIWINFYMGFSNHFLFYSESSLLNCWACSADFHLRNSNKNPTECHEPKSELRTTTQNNQ
jgi:hypothetical protein